MTPEVWAYFGTVILERGLPAAVNLYERFKKVDPMLSDLEALRGWPSIRTRRSKMSPKTKAWLKGLAVAVITAVATGLLQLLLNPTEVALWTWAQWKAALILSGVFGLIAMLTYIAKSPWPSSDPAQAASPGPVAPETPSATPAEQKESTASGQDLPK